jgi:N-acyl-D-amino-acid deacylase
MLDLLIKNTWIIDGSGDSGFLGSVGSEDGLIHLLQADTNADAKRVIDGTGLYTCPGFIDAHSHGDISLGKDFASLCKVSQGITTQVAGMCSYSLFPVSSSYWKLWRENCSLFLAQSDFPEEMPSFTSAETYFSYAESLKIPENIRILAGSGALRCCVMGDDNREPTRAELENMKSLLREAMQAGAGGMSTGLVYIPSTYEKPREITELAQIVAEYGGVYDTHMRDESIRSIDAVKEAIDVARETGVRLVISHHKLQGKACWGQSKETIQMMEEANEEGLEVGCDQYPYTSCMSLLSDCCPPWYYSEGLSGIVKYLEDPISRNQIQREMEDPTTPYENYYINAGGWDGIFVTSSENLPQAAKKTIAQYAKEIDADPFEAYCRIMIANQGVGGAIYHTMCDEDLLRIIQYKNTAVCTDGLLRSRYAMSHPRAFGSFPRAIRVFVKEHHLFSLEEMIRKMTSLTADRYHIKNKGRVQNGYDADLLVFDYKKLTDKATYSDPTVLSEGFRTIINGGQVIYEEQRLTGAAPGKVLRYKM